MTLALFALGGSESPVDTEDVAVRAAQLVPGMFAWRRYPEHIDKELVRVALSDARLKKGWVVGSHNKGGWLLTPAGQEFSLGAAAQLDAPAEHRRSGREERHAERERVRLLTSSAFAEITASGHAEGVTADEADAFFRINVYVQGQARDRKIARIENQFRDDPELGHAVRLLAALARSREEK